MSQQTPQNVLIAYNMSGQLLSNTGPAPYQSVYWTVYGTPDLTGQFSGYAGQLQNIQYTTEQISGGVEVVVPTSPAGGDLTGNYPNPQIATVSNLTGDGYGVLINTDNAGTLGVLPYPSTPGTYVLDVSGHTGAWTPSQAIGNYPATIIGQNSSATPFSACLDDSPVIQAFINATANSATTLNCVNVVLKTALNFAPWNGLYAKLSFGGINRYALNVAELDIVQTMNVNGDLGGGDGGIFDGAELDRTIHSPNSTFVGYNSAGVTAPEPLQTSTNGYIDGYNGGSEYLFTYLIQLNQAGYPYPDTVFGKTLTVTSIPSGGGNSQSFLGTYIVIRQGNAIGSTDLLLVWTGNNSSPPSGYAGGISWNIAGTSYSGTAAQFDSSTAQGPNNPVIRVHNCPNINKNECWKQWLELLNCTSSVMNTKLHRIMGTDGTNLYINANVPWNSSVALPDYGVGGSSGSPKLNTYQATPVFRINNYNTLANLSTVSAAGPSFVIDGDNVYTSQQNQINNCGVTFESSAGLPMIVNGCFWFQVDGFYTGYSGTGGACILVTCTDTYYGQDVSIGQFSNIQLADYGIMLRTEVTDSAIADMDFSHVITEYSVPFPGQSAALIYFDGICGGGLYGLSTVSCSSADSASAVLEVIYIASNTTAEDISIDQGSIGEGFGLPAFGPKAIAYNLTMLSNNYGFKSSGFNSSMTDTGVHDVLEVGRNDSFAPIMTLPYQVPLPPLLTVANWQALGVIDSLPTFSYTDADGYNIIGPDLSSGKMIRIQSPTGNEGVYIIPSYTVANVNVNDTFLVFMRVKSESGAAVSTACGQFFRWNTYGGSLFEPGAQICGILQPRFCTYVTTGDRWCDVCCMAQVVTAVSPLGINVYLGSAANDAIYIDPESISVMYIPASNPSGEALSLEEVNRIHRKVRTQITAAPPGNVALPSRTGLSFGGVADIINRSLTTTATSATAIHTHTVGASQAFQLQGNWVALCDPIADGYTSAGAFTIAGFNNAGTVTVSSVNTLGSNYNCGAGGAAAATPITVTTASNQVIIKVTAEYTGSTDWQMMIHQIGVY